ncbi:VWA domain-containing protein [Candidatus Poribacteria bacterium]|nr:VWA domain-containing protein [Candidatus Poribacteria bacterium]
MNNRLLQKAFQREHRKRAFRISLIVHGIAIILLMLNLYFKSDISEAEDEIQIDILSELPRQQKKRKKVLPIPKKETETETPIELSKQRRTMQQKQTTVKHIQTSAAIQKMEGGSAANLQPDIQSAASKTADVLEVLDTPDLSTDADLTPSPDSVLTPIGGDSVTPNVKSVGKREGTFERGSGKGTKSGLSINPSQTGAGKTGSGTGGTTGKGKTGSGTGDTFSSVIQQLADDIIQSSGGAPIDVVFVIDASGSMLDNIHAVAEHLIEMIDAYKASEIDYQLGLTRFNVHQNGTNNIHVSSLTTNLSQYKQMLYAISVSGDEHALDAIHQTLDQMKFRGNTVKHLILLTDEPFTSLSGKTLGTAIQVCQQNEIYVNVLGENIGQHKKLAEQTGGTWHAIRKDEIPQQVMTTQQPKNIGRMIRTSAANFPTDIILFIDTSESMESKKPYIAQQIDTWLRDWDNAHIDYRVGVVRFRAKGATNIVNVYNPPQTQSQIHKILKIPFKDNENLLSAIQETVRRIKTRPNAQTHFIVFTDEPGDPKQTTGGTLQLIKQMPAIVSVIGTTNTFHQQLAQQTGGIWVAIPNGHKRNDLYH